jgi:hypothetical protein
MSLTPTLHRAGAAALTRPALLLIATLVAFVGYVVVAVGTISQEVGTSADLTPTQLDSLGAAWFVLHLLWVTPPILAATALTLLSRGLPVAGRGVPVLAAITGTCAVAYLLVNLLAYGSQTSTWGENALYPWSVSLSLAAGWFGVLPATVLVSTALARQGIAPRTAWTVTALVGLYWAIEVLSYLPVLLGPGSFAEFEGGLPPFLMGFFWAILGGGILRARVTSQG